MGLQNKKKISLKKGLTNTLTITMDIPLDVLAALHVEDTLVGIEDSLISAAMAWAKTRAEELRAVYPEEHAYCLAAL